MCIRPTPSAVPRLCVIRERVTASPDKVKAVREYPTPKNVKDVRAFLGLASFYRKLVPNFAELAKPLRILTRNNQVFSWSPKKQEAFLGL